MSAQDLLTDIHALEDKHEPPDIKHHRLPAPNMRFERPNLPEVIVEVETLVKQTGA